MELLMCRSQTSQELREWNWGELDGFPVFPTDVGQRSQNDDSNFAIHLRSWFVSNFVFVSLNK